MRSDTRGGTRETAYLEGIIEALCRQLAPPSADPAAPPPASASGASYANPAWSVGAPPAPPSCPLTVNGQLARSFAFEQGIGLLGEQVGALAGRLFPLDTAALLGLLGALPLEQRAVLELSGVAPALREVHAGGEVSISALEGVEIDISALLNASDLALSVPLGEETLTLTSPTLRLGEIRVSRAAVAISAPNLTFASDGAGPVAVSAGRVTLSESGISVAAPAYGLGDPAEWSRLPDVDVGSASGAPPPDSLRIEACVAAEMTVLFNASSPHANAAMLGEVSAAAWRFIHNETASAASAGAPSSSSADTYYRVHNHPLPLTAAQSAQACGSDVRGRSSRHFLDYS